MPEHAAVACRACCEMQNRLTELRKKWRADNLPELHMRIGMCTGPAVVGNMGSRNRMDYTMMGDTVNIAARLEGCNKIYGLYALISDTTRAAAGDAIVAREIDAIQVVGREAPVRVYQPMGTPDTVDEASLALIQYYEAGLAAYRNQQWDAAIEAFDKAQTIAIDDPPSRVMAARCRTYKAEPPATGWSGAFTMTTK